MTSGEKEKVNLSIAIRQHLIHNEKLPTGYGRSAYKMPMAPQPTILMTTYPKERN